MVLGMGRTGVGWQTADLLRRKVVENVPRGYLGPLFMKDTHGAVSGGKRHSVITSNDGGTVVGDIAARPALVHV